MFFLFASNLSIRTRLIPGEASYSGFISFYFCCLNFGGAENVYSFTVDVLLLVSEAGGAAGAVGAGAVGRDCDSGSVTGASVVSCDSKTLS